MSWESSHERGIKRDKREKITSLPFITIGLRGRLQFFVIEPGHPRQNGRQQHARQRAVIDNICGRRKSE